MRFTHITSADNPFVRTLRKLLDSSRERRKAGHAVLDGWHLLEDYRRVHGAPERLVLAERLAADSSSVAALEGLGLQQATVLADSLFDALAPVEQATGVLAVIAIPAPLARDGSCILLEDIQDPGNLGSMLRTAAAAGMSAAHLSKGCADAWSPRALRGGMGAHFRLAVHEHADLAAVARAFAGQVVATTLQGAQSLYELDLRDTTAFAFGNEGAGLSAELLAIATHRACIPMPGQTESLNAAAAAAVCLFESVRQRLKS